MLTVSEALRWLHIYCIKEHHIAASLFLTVAKGLSSLVAGGGIARSFADELRGAWPLRDRYCS